MFGRLMGSFAFPVGQTGKGERIPNIQPQLPTAEGENPDFFPSLDGLLLTAPVDVQSLSIAAGLSCWGHEQ